MFDDNIFKTNQRPIEITEEQAKAARIDRFGYDPENPQEAPEGPMPQPKVLPGTGYEPGLFEGAWEAPFKGLGAAALGTAGTAMSLVGEVIPDGDTFRPYAKDLRKLNRKWFEPDPEEMGQVGQIIRGLFEYVPKFAVYTAATGNPVIGATAFGIDTGAGEYYRLRDEGVKTSTAMKAGAVTGVGNMLGGVIPAAVGSSRAMSVIYGSASNVALDAGERAAVRTILENDNYQKIANRYETSWADVALSAGLGGFFGAIAWRSPEQIQRQLREDQINRRADAIASIVTKKLKATDQFPDDEIKVQVAPNARSAAALLENAGKSDDEIADIVYRDMTSIGGDELGMPITQGRQWIFGDRASRNPDRMVRVTDVASVEEKGRVSDVVGAELDKYKIDSSKRLSENDPEKFLKNDDTGWLLSINGGDRSEIISAVTKRGDRLANLAAVKNLRELVKNAFLAESYRDIKAAQGVKGADTSIKGIHRFYAPMRLGGENYLVKLTVKDKVGQPKERGALKDDRTALYQLVSIESSKMQSAQSVTSERSNEVGTLTADGTSRPRSNGLSRTNQLRRPHVEPSLEISVREMLTAVKRDGDARFIDGKKDESSLSGFFVNEPNKWALEEGGGYYNTPEDIASWESSGEGQLFQRTIKNLGIVNLGDNVKNIGSTYREGGFMPLMTVHNISQENLVRVNDLGGLAVPSLGITSANNPFTTFGDITLIGTRGMVDPASGVPVFSQDAYSRRFPRPDWSQSVNKEAANRFIDDFTKAAEESGNRGEASSLSHKLKTSPDRGDVAREFARSTTARTKFLREKGVSVEPELTYPYRPNAFDAFVMHDFVRVFNDPGTAPGSVEKQRALSEVYADAVERNPEAAGRFAVRRAQNVRDGKMIDWSLLSSFAAKYENLVRNEARADQARVNDVLTRQKIDAEIEKRSDAFGNWVEKKIAPLFGEPKVRVGRKLLPMTLENVVRSMTSRSVRNEEKTLTTGPGKVRAAAARRFDSIEDIQKERGRIASTADVAASNADIDARMQAFREQASSGYEGANPLFSYDAAMNALVDAAKARGKVTPERVKAALRSNGIKPTDDVASLGASILEDVRKAITDYFEAKPQRSVSLGEFVGAVVPEGTSPDVVKILTDAGLEVRTASPDNRVSAASKLARDLNDSRGDVLYQRGSNTLNQIAYHGTPYVFDRFTLDHIGSGEGAQAHGWGLYFALDKKVADGYRERLTGDTKEGFVEKKLVRFGKKLKDALSSNRVSLGDIQTLYSKIASDSLPNVIEDMPGINGRSAEDIKARLGNPSREEARRLARVLDFVNDEIENRNTYDDFMENLESIKPEVRDYVKQTVLNGETWESTKGRLYSVDIPEDNVMLREDAKLEDQPDGVQIAVHNLLDGWYEKFTGEQFPGTRRGYEILAILEENLGGPKAAAMALKNEGVLGLRYEGGRDGECAVVWSEDAIGIRDALEQRLSSHIAGSYSAKLNRIILTALADLSTFSHEHAHWYMTKLLAYAGEKGMSSEIVQDALRLLNAMGIKSLDDWNAMSFEQQRVYHERFGAWVEIYLSKGRSPIRSLDDVFKRFGEWLVDMYRNKFGKTAEEHVGDRYKSEFDEDLPPLSDEVMAALDRMYGADAKARTVIPSVAQTVAARIAQAERANTDKVTSPMKDRNSDATYRAAKAAQIDARDQMNEGQKVDVSSSVREDDANADIVSSGTKTFARTAQMGGENDTIVVLQNRDRSTVASQAQMNSIAADPQYGKMSFSRTTDSGAPIVSYGSLPADEFVGNTDYVSDGGNRIPVTYVVVEADSILTSNTWDGRQNEAYGTDPEQIQAVAGNGRVAGLQEAYNRGTTDAYVQEMQADATHGVSPEAIGKLQKPVLVRYVGRENVTTGFVDRSNQSAVLDLSGKERAVKDAGKLTSSRMRGYTFDEDGNPTRDTLERFVNDIGEPSSLGAMIDDSGLPTDRARDRIRAAVFYSAYRDEDLTSLVVDSSDKQGIKRILNAMSAFAPNVIAIREASNGAIDIGPVIVEAVNRIRSGRLIGEGDMFEETNPAVDQVFNILSQNRNSAAAIGRVFNDFMDRIESALGGGTDALFGDAPDLAMAMQYLRAAENAQGERLIELGKEFSPLPDIDVEAVRATMAAIQEAAPNAEKVAVAMGEKVLEDAGAATKAEPAVETQTIDPIDPTRAGLVFTETADVERLRNLFAEDPEASYVIEGPDGVAREMTAQDILDMERQYAEQGQTDAVGIGKATECILRNGGIKE